MTGIVREGRKGCGLVCIWYLSFGMTIQIDIYWGVGGEEGLRFGVYLVFVFGDYWGGKVYHMIRLTFANFRT